MDNTQLMLGFVEQALGTGKRTSGNNYAFHCPVCQHHKPKLEVDMESEQYNCWTCSPATKGRGIVYLFKKLKISNDLIVEVKKYSKYKDKTVESKEQAPEVKLPDEYKSILDNLGDLTAKKALYYLNSRGVTEEHIIKYNIGYCEYGKYRNSVIVPSYNSEGKLNYWIGRSFDKEATYKFMAPKCDKSSIVGFENRINWNVPVILCEGAFDSLAIMRNSVPLFGKTITEGLMLRLVQPEVKTVYIALDNDAIKNAVHYAEKLINMGKDVYLVELEGKDPSELGFEGFTKLLHNAKKFSVYEILMKRLKLI